MTGIERSGAERAPVRTWPLVVLTGAMLLATAAPTAGQATVPTRTPTPEYSSSRGWLGVNVTVIRTSGQPEDRIVVEDVWDGGPALEAGLRPGDRIVRVNGVPVTGERFRSMTRRLEPGDPMTLHILRDGTGMDVSIVADTRPDRAVLVPRELQEELDLVRSRLSRILEETQVRVTTLDQDGTRVDVLAPNIVVDGVRGDSIATRVILHGDSLTSRVRVERIHGTGRAEQDLHVVTPRPEAPVPFTVWIQTTDSVGAAGIASANSASRIRVEEKARREAEEGARLAVRIGGEPSPAPVLPGTPEPGSVRPLAPYVAGLNRVAGAEMRDMTPELAPYFGVDRGVLVTGVADRTPAGVAGLRAGDVILEVNDIPVSSMAGLRELLARHRSGITLEVLRKQVRTRIELR